MPRFVFELQSVLKARLAEERQEQLAVASIEVQRARLEQMIRECQQGIVQARDDLRDRLSAEQSGTQVDLAGVRMQAGASLHLVARTQRAVLELAGVHSRLDAARLKLLAAATRRKAVEALRDRRYEAWREAERRADANAMDEIAMALEQRRERDS